MISNAEEQSETSFIRDQVLRSVSRDLGVDGVDLRVLRL